MSWDVYLYTKSGHGRVVECGNCTYNVAPMYEKAGIPNGSLNDLNGVSAKKMAEILTPAVQYMTTHSDEMLALSPSNGWGHYDGALFFLREILRLCLKYPRRIVGVS